MVRLRLFGPELADAFVGCEAFEGLETFGEVVGVEAVGQVAAELFVAVVVGAADGGLLDRRVHAFDLATGPGPLVQGWLGLIRRGSIAGLGAGAFEGVGTDWRW